MVLAIGCAGIEYIVSDRIFEALPPEEQKLWHSHAYEVKLNASNLPSRSPSLSFKFYIIIEYYNSNIY